MSFARLAFLAATAIIGVAGFAAPASAEIIIRAGTTVPEADNPQTAAFKAMQEYIAFRSGGEMKVEVFYNGALGGDRELLEQVQQNTLQFTAVADGAIANFFPEIQVVAIPYLFSSTHHALEFFNTSPFFKDVKDRMEKETKIKVLLAAESGFRNITNNAHPIKTPADMSGLKMRTMESPVFMELMRSVGAAPTPIAFNETILALRQGVVDGQENAVATVRMFGVWEVQKYMSINEHVYSPALVTTSSDFYNSLTDAQKQIFNDGVFVWASVSNAGYIANYAKDIEFMKEKGVDIYVNTAEEKAEFKAAMQPPVLKFIAERVGQDKVDAFIAAVEETRKQLYGLQ
jgi:tripartite ATP-independent transporter DctP family solute receptor